MYIYRGPPLISQKGLGHKVSLPVYNPREPSRGLSIPQSNSSSITTCRQNPQKPLIVQVKGDRTIVAQFECDNFRAAKNMIMKEGRYLPVSLFKPDMFNSSCPSLLYIVKSDTCIPL